MRKILVIAWLVAGCASASAEPLSWQKYTVPETAATVLACGVPPDAAIGLMSAACQASWPRTL